LPEKNALQCIIIWFED